MIIAIDVGNTNIRLGVVRGADVAAARVADASSATTAEGLEATLEALLQQDGASLGDVDEMVVASVVPAATEMLAQIANRRSIALLDADHTNLPMPIRVEHPAGVGNDRLVNAFAASRLYGQPAIVVDLGTATTFDVVAADGAFVGGAIAPGAGLGIDALASRTAQLPRVDLATPSRAIGRNTVEAMQSGAVLGHVGLVTELIRAITAELALDGGPAPKIILTGGLSAEEWARAIPNTDAIDPLLTLRGLAIMRAGAARHETLRSA